jgi:hypothetical protein
MKKLQSILCASLLTLSICSVGFAGQISGRDGQISGRNGQISGRNGQISGAPGQISGAPDPTDEISISDILGIMIWDVLLG